MMKYVFFTAVLLLFISCKQASNNDKSIVTDPSEPVVVKPDLTTVPAAATATWVGIHKMNDKDFAQKIATTSGLTVVDFSAEWCGPCKALHPILESLAKQMEGKVNFGNVDVDESPKIATELNISSIPLLVFYKNGKIVDKTVGLMPEKDLVDKINSLL